jgi:hypothetical protein
VTGGPALHRDRRPDPARGERSFDLVDIVARTGKPADHPSATPERSQILALCEAPVTVADLASAAGLPLGVIRVLLDDLGGENLIEVRATAPRGRKLVRQVLDALHAL